MIFIPLLMFLSSSTSLSLAMPKYDNFYGKDEGIRAYLYEKFNKSDIKSETRVEEVDNATLRMQVVDEDGAPLEDAEVIIKNFDDKSEKAMESKSDEDGFVQFRGLAPEEYNIEVAYNSAGLKYDRQRIHLTNYIVNTKTIFPHREYKAFTIAYLLVDQYDRPIKKARLCLKDSKGRTYEATSDEYGYAYFKLSDPDTYEVYLKSFPEEITSKADKKLMIFPVKAYSIGNTIMYKSREEVSYTDKYKSNLVLSLKFIDLYDDLSIVLKDKDRDLIYNGNPDPEGLVVFNNLLPGNYQIKVVKGNSLISSINTFISKEDTYIYDIVSSLDDVNNPLILSPNLYVDPDYKESKKPTSAQMILSRPHNLILTAFIGMTSFLAFRSSKNVKDNSKKSL